jgi:YggT family protein
MFVFSNLIIAVASILDWVLELYKWVIIISALISWVNPDPYNPIVKFLRSITEPLLRPIRRAIGYRLGPIDVSPLVVILAIVFIQKFLISSLVELAYKMKIQGGGII